MIPRLGGALALLGTLIVPPHGRLDAAPTPSTHEAQGKGRPKAELRVNPGLILPPARVVATLELTKGANDYQDYYCPKIEWEWGDGTRSESVEDCAPYEAGKSEIRRRFTEDHRYQHSGFGAMSYEIVFRMKQGSETVLTQRQRIRVQDID
jgi:hypothetical protein